jgi:hypothetical protein
MLLWSYLADRRGRMLVKNGDWNLSAITDRSLDSSLLFGFPSQEGGLVWWFLPDVCSLWWGASSWFDGSDRTLAGSPIFRNSVSWMSLKFETESERFGTLASSSLNFDILTIQFCSSQQQFLSAFPSPFSSVYCEKLSLIESGRLSCSHQ